MHSVDGMEQKLLEKTTWLMLLYMNYVMKMNAEWKLNLDNAKHDKSASFRQTQGLWNTDKPYMDSSDKRSLVNKQTDWLTDFL